MNSTTENNLYLIWKSAANKTSCLDADRIIEPLRWYIATGRCTGSFVLAFNKLSGRQLTAIANRLIKFNGTDYSSAIDSVKAYIQ